MSMFLTESWKSKLQPMHGLMKGGDSGAGAQAEATNRGIDLQRDQWNQVMAGLAPFTPLAEQYVKQMQGLSTLQGQNDALSGYYNSAQYKGLADQARGQMLASAEATGGLGSTTAQNSLATIAPQLGQSWLNNQMGNYQNLANIGLGALQGQANAGQSYANNSSQLYQQQAAASAANANKPSGAQSFLTGAAGGAAMGATVGGPWGAAIGGAIGGIGSLR